MSRPSDRLRIIVPWICGILAALLWAGLVGIATALAGGYCASQPDCQREIERDLYWWLATTAVLALLFGLAVRRLVDWSLACARDSVTAGRPPLSAVSAVLILGGVMLWMGSLLCLS
jgi:hypothetical protein